MAEEVGNNSHFAYFGFGSLVNRNTLSNDIVDIIPVKLKGWRRHWQPRPQQAMASEIMRSIALLSVHQDPTCEISGLIIIDRIDNLKDLDERERGYQKVSLNKSNFTFENNDLDRLDETSIHVYQSHLAGMTQGPVSLLRSYLDVVMQGYLREFGEAGIASFIESTKGFDLQILEDREKPIYSRHQSISDDECAIFERFLPNL